MLGAEGGAIVLYCLSLSYYWAPIRDYLFQGDHLFAPQGKNIYQKNQSLIAKMQ